MWSDMPLHRLSCFISTWISHWRRGPAISSTRFIRCFFYARVCRHAVEHNLPIARHKRHCPRARCYRGEDIVGNDLRQLGMHSISLPLVSTREGRQVREIGRNICYSKDFLRKRNLIACENRMSLYNKKLIDYKDGINSTYNVKN